ncbi:MAG: hypothetical protein II575_10780 [Bacteroidales bacterium]|nr:hypothetical protein [Bacteroidales bacterium]
MKLTSAILATITALMVFLTSNGIVYEHYFCKCCNEEHQEISLFEFGEVSHNHECHSHHECHNHHCDGHHCHCQDKSEHQKHTHIEFMSLKDLFQHDAHSALPEIPSISIFATNFAHICESNINNLATNQLLTFSSDATIRTNGKVCPLLSCFRL